MWLTLLALCDGFVACLNACLSFHFLKFESIDVHNVILGSFKFGKSGHIIHEEAPRTWIVRCNVIQKGHVVVKAKVRVHILHIFRLNLHATKRILFPSWHKLAILLILLLGLCVVRIQKEHLFLQLKTGSLSLFRKHELRVGVGIRRVLTFSVTLNSNLFLLRFWAVIRHGWSLWATPWKTHVWASSLTSSADQFTTALLVDQISLAWMFTCMSHAAPQMFRMHRHIEIALWNVIKAVCVQKLRVVLVHHRLDLCHFLSAVIQV